MLKYFNFVDLLLILSFEKFILLFELLKLRIFVLGGVRLVEV